VSGPELKNIGEINSKGRQKVVAMRIGAKVGDIKVRIEGPCNLFVHF